MNLDFETPLREVLFPGGKVPELLPEHLHSTSAYQALGKRVDAKVPQVFWRGVREEVRKGLEDSLNISIGQVLVDAWKQWQTLQKYCDPQLYPPDTTVRLTLLEPKLETRQDSHVDLKFDGETMGAIAFQLTAEFSPTLAVLRVRSGRIWAIETGAAAGKVTLSCEGQAIYSKTSPTIPLPGALTFENGIAIPHSEAHSVPYVTRS